MRAFAFLLTMVLLTSCIGTAQNGHMRFALEKFGECNFTAALEAANEAINLGKADKKAYILSLFIKAKSLEKLDRVNEADKTYEVIVKNSNKLKTIEEAKNAANTLNSSSKDCKEQN